MVYGQSGTPYIVFFRGDCEKKVGSLEKKRLMYEKKVLNENQIESIEAPATVVYWPKARLR